MELVRHDPLETDMRRRMATALRAVNGVATADEQDREVWFVTGTPSGKELTEAAARVVDELAGESAPPCVAYKGATLARASPARSRSGRTGWFGAMAGGLPRSVPPCRVHTVVSCCR